MSWKTIEIGKIGLWVAASLILTFCSALPLQAQQQQHLQARLEDGVMLNVYLKEALQPDPDFDYAKEVLQLACQAYREIVFKQGFNRSGYTFAQPNELFAYDRDKDIDIYIADVQTPYALIQPQQGREYKAEIYVPSDYQAYRERYKITQPHLELKANLTHELLHIITYSYNRNMESVQQGSASLSSQGWDWYTEGLARYFEALVGYREEFLSSGFRKKSEQKILVYKGGVNYFLKHPDKPLNERKYDFALFWMYLHQNYGMNKIEEISSKFRQVDPQVCSHSQAMEILAQTLGVKLQILLQDFSLFVYEVSSLPAQKQDELQPVYMTKLFSEPGLDLITPESICSFGYDFYEVDLNQPLESVELVTIEAQRDLNCLIGLYSPSNSIVKQFTADYTGKIKIDLKSLPQESKMVIMLSNPTSQTISYQISLN